MERSLLRKGQPWVNCSKVRPRCVQECVRACSLCDCVCVHACASDLSRLIVKRLAHGVLIIAQPSKLLFESGDGRHVA